MNAKRGDVVVVDWPFSSGAGSKSRPALVVQNDGDNVRLTNVIIAMFTSVTRRSNVATQLLVDVSTPDGRQSGLHRDSVVNCANLFTVDRERILTCIGGLPPPLMERVNDCLRAALDLN